MTSMTSTSTPAVRLSDYDLVVVNSSGGKDSQAMLTTLVAQADAEGFDRSNLVVVHADLGRVEWEGTRELAETQAQFYGLRFVAVSRPQGDLLTQIEARGMFPSSTARYCTSDQKTGQVARVLTAETTKALADRKARGIFSDRPVRILNALGLRAQESPARAKKVPFGPDKRASNGKRAVDRWLPIFEMTEDEVWETIKASGVPSHPAYDAGMPRLSCCFCVLASKGALVRAAQLNPGLAEEYRAVEARIGHTFRQDLSMADIIAAAETSTEVVAEDWNA